MRAPTSKPPSSSCNSRARLAFSRSATLCKWVDSSTSSRVRCFDFVLQLQLLIAQLRGEQRAAAHIQIHQPR